MRFGLAAVQAAAGPMPDICPVGQMVVGGGSRRRCPPSSQSASDEKRPDPRPDRRVLPPGPTWRNRPSGAGRSMTASWCTACARASGSPSTRWTGSRPISQPPCPDGVPPPRGLEVPPEKRDPRGNFRFFENRQKYLLFVHTCSEKRVIADRVALELSSIHPRPPALRVFDAGVGDGTVLARVMRSMHGASPTCPSTSPARSSAWRMSG